MPNLKIKRAKAFQEAKLRGIKSINKCFHPNCHEESINSHILQKNGTLSKMEYDGHLMQMEINPFGDDMHFFKKTGIGQAFSFNCFCNGHDTELFRLIEKSEIDFNEYRSNLLFTLRTIYNEKFRKMVNKKMKTELIENYEELFNIEYLTADLEQEKLGIADIEKTENLIWKDLIDGTESFIFLTRKIKQIPICLSSFYNYETTEELESYKLKHGIDKEDVSDIFINVFPYQDISIFMMGYKKQDELAVKQYVNSIVKESEKRLLRQFTNLLLFQCETWVTSIDFYNERIKKCEKYFGKAAAFSGQNKNERAFFKLNLFGTNFCNEIQTWYKNIG